MSPKRLPGSPVPWVILVILSAALAVTPARADSGHRTAKAPRATSPASLSGFGHSLVSFAHRLHYRHHVRVTLPGDGAFSLPVRLEPDSGNQAIQTPSMLCWAEPCGAEPPVPTALLTASNRPPAECGEYSERRTPRGPPLAL
ncbi:MAG: hypothetical protein KGN76_14930 [Acidobacteriota bacterium]|nr:hypothetical protein [Acidobacteriota bacterium]